MTKEGLASVVSLCFLGSEFLPGGVDLTVELNWPLKWSDLPLAHIFQH